MYPVLCPENTRAALISHSLLKPTTPLMSHEWVNERNKRRQEEWWRVFVPEPNEASNSTKRWLQWHFLLSKANSNTSRGRTSLSSAHSVLTHLQIHFSCLAFLSISSLFSLQDHIYQLMKSDSYARFLRSNIYQDLLLARKKVSRTRWWGPPLLCTQLNTLLISQTVFMLCLWFYLKPTKIMTILYECSQ